MFQVSWDKLGIYYNRLFPPLTWNNHSFLALCRYDIFLLIHNTHCIMQYMQCNVCNICNAHIFHGTSSLGIFKHFFSILVLWKILECLYNTTIKKSAWCDWCAWCAWLQLSLHHQWLFGTWFYRPEETFHTATRKFLEKVRAPLCRLLHVPTVFCTNDFNAEFFQILVTGVIIASHTDILRASSHVPALGTSKWVTS